MKLIIIYICIFKFINKYCRRNIKRNQLTLLELKFCTYSLVKKSSEGDLASELAALRKGQSVPSFNKVKELDAFLGKF